MNSSLPTLAVIGGTGAQGSGLALRWAKAGYPIVIGSRNAERAAEAADALKAVLPDASVDAAENLAAAEAGDIVILTVPYAAHADTVERIRSGVADKILVEVTVPLVPPKVSVVQLPPDGAAALATQRLVGDDVKVVAAFQNVSAQHLKDLDHDIDCDVLICGADKDAKQIVAALAGAGGMRAVDAGPLANAAAVEAMTAVLIGINRRYKVPGAGVRITGLPDSAP